MFTQECLRREEAASRAPTREDEAARAPAPAVVVSYNDLCFPKTSNYGSMRKAGRCEVLAVTRGAGRTPGHGLQANNAEYAYSSHQ